MFNSHLFECMWCHHNWRAYYSTNNIFLSCQYNISSIYFIKSTMLNTYSIYLLIPKSGEVLFFKSFSNEIFISTTRSYFTPSIYCPLLYHNFSLTLVNWGPRSNHMYTAVLEIIHVYKYVSYVKNSSRATVFFLTSTSKWNATPKFFFYGSLEYHL